MRFRGNSPKRYRALDPLSDPFPKSVGTRKPAFLAKFVSEAKPKDRDAGFPPRCRKYGREGKPSESETGKPMGKP